MTHKNKDVVAAIWYNLPSHASTFSPCSRGCGRGIGGRSGGPCLDCAIEDLSLLIGQERAKAYAEAVRMIRNVEREILG